jgi:hypothetical protein
MGITQVNDLVFTTSRRGVTAYYKGEFLAGWRLDGTKTVTHNTESLRQWKQNIVVTVVNNIPQWTYSSTTPGVYAGPLSKQYSGS